MTGFVPPTEKMWGYLYGLAGERDYPELGDAAETRLAVLELRRERGLASGFDRYAAMELIDRLKEAPLDLDGSPIQPGAYQHNGEVLIVQLNRDKTRLYTKRLVEIGGRRLNANDEVVKIDFEYAPGMLSRLRPAERMTWEEAKPFIIRYGMCLFGHPLKDAKSVELGIGPVCRKMFAEFRKPPPPVVDTETSAGLAALLPGGRSA
jgi:Family of unknown function (DUF6011)